MGKHIAFLEELVTEFDNAGYDVRKPWKVLNAGNFGTPQSRERLFLVGAKKGNTIPEYPEPLTNMVGRKKRIAGLPDGPSCRDALGDLRDADDFFALLNTDEVKATALGKPSSYSAEMRVLSNNAWHFGYPREWDPTVLTSSARTEHTEISRRRFADTEPGTVEPISRFFRLSAEGVSNTLRAGTDGTRGAFTSPRPIHYRYARCITVREMARLHGFPDWFRLNATKWHGARQIGNAVPPPLARAVAAQVIKTLGFEPTRPAETMKLGDPGLLTLDYSGATAHFGIEGSPQRRDRKSGAKKRKQIEIEQERLAAVAGPGTHG